MEEIKNLQEKFQSMTDEEKLSYVTNLYMQSMQAIKKMRYLEDQTVYKKLDYLFKVVEAGTFNEPFTTKCEEEIEMIIFGPEPAEGELKEE